MEAQPGGAWSCMQNGSVSESSALFWPCAGCPLCPQRRAQDADLELSREDAHEDGRVPAAGINSPAGSLTEPSRLASPGAPGPRYDLPLGRGPQLQAAGPPQQQQQGRAGHSEEKPRRIFLVRHGQSEGNVDATVYTREADWRVPLTLKGFSEAEECGKRIRAAIERAHAQEAAAAAAAGEEGAGEWGVFFYVSPYTRTLQTLRGIGRAFDERHILGVREEPRLREQDFGNFQVKERMEKTKDARQRFGKFFFRFPEGESAADVYDRVTGFLDSFWRDVDWGRMYRVPRQGSQRSSAAGRASSRSSLTTDAAAAAAVGASIAAAGPQLAGEGGRRKSFGDAAAAREENSRAPGGVPAVQEACKPDSLARHPGSDPWQRSSDSQTQGGAPNGVVGGLSEAMRRGPPPPPGSDRRMSVNVVMVTHGLTLRVFLMRWFRWTVAQFEGLFNPRNCEIRVMQVGPGGRYSLAHQHSEEEMLSWGLSPCMVADQMCRATAVDSRAPQDPDAPPPWACFFDHLPWKQAGQGIYRQPLGFGELGPVGGSDTPI